MLLFSQILGQPRPLTALRRAIGGQKLAHAYLFSGPEGVGKATTARALAAALNCETAVGQGCAVGQARMCEACAKLAGGHHPDFLVLEPDGQFIKIEQVRTLEQRLAFPPHEARYRVVVLDGAERLNASAANALLKAVEEPRPGTVFVLVSSAVHRVMPTLISRCQRLHFAPLADHEVLAALAAAAEQPEAALRAAAAVAEGSPGRALAMIANDALAAARGVADGLVRAAHSEQAVDVFEAAAEAGREKDQLRQVLDLLRVRLRNLLLAAADLGERVAGGDAALAEEARALGSGRILRQLRAVQEAEGALLGNVNPSLLLETLVFRLREDTLR